MKNAILTFVALALIAAGGCRPRKAKPLTDAELAAMPAAERTLEQLRRHLPAWAYYDGKALKKACRELEAFDIVAIAPGSADAESVERLRKSGCEVTVEELAPAPEFGKDIRRIANGLCWIDFDPLSLRREDPRSAEAGPELIRVMDALRSDRSMRVFALARREMDGAEWKTFERACRALRFIPYAAPPGADAVNANAHASAAEVPRR